MQTKDTLLTYSKEELIDLIELYAKDSLALDEKQRPENVVLSDVVVNGKPVRGPEDIVFSMSGPAVQPKFAQEKPARQ